MVASIADSCGLLRCNARWQWGLTQCCGRANAKARSDGLSAPSGRLRSYLLSSGLFGTGQPPGLRRQSRTTASFGQPCRPQSASPHSPRCWCSTGVQSARDGPGTLRWVTLAIAGRSAGVPDGISSIV